VYIVRRNEEEDVPVSTERSSAGDPARTLALLWRDPTPAPSRGPGRGLDVDAVVAAATDLADREGLEAVTMRRLAKELGVAAMTLYTYVPGKTELVDLMLDAAYSRLPLADTTTRPWRQRLSAVASENRALYQAHPWAAAVSTLRPPLGPGLIAKYDHELRALEGLGLSDVAMDDALTHLLSFVQANARTAADARAAQMDSAMDDQAWWAANASLLARVLDPDAYPLATRVGTAAGTAHGSAHNPDHAYHFGLDRLLDGLAALIDTHT
jgi:AcrR family transcriptional regulator